LIPCQAVFSHQTGWVVQLGPQTFDEDASCAPCYEYAVLTDPFGLNLNVLARDPTTFWSTYNTTVFETLMQEGFTRDYNRPTV
jgi:hypothetical protein